MLTGNRIAYYWAAFSTCAAGALTCIWSAKYLPMVDLPQHAAQIALWKLLGQPAYPYANRFEFNWYTPYVLSVFIGRLLATVMPAAAAVKCVLSLAVLGLPLAIGRLLDHTGGDRWWALLGFPLAFGHSFYWGLMPHLVAVPLGIGLVAEGFRYASKPTRQGIALIGALALLLLVSHVLVLVLSVMVVAIVVVRLTPSRRAALAGCLPLGVVMALAAAWFTGSHIGRASGVGLTVWGYGVFRRLMELPGVLFGDLQAVQGFFSTGPHAEVFRSTVLLCAAILLLPVVGGLRPVRSGVRWAPAAVAALFYLFLPLHPFGSHFVYTRYAVFLIPFAMVGFDWPESETLCRMARLLVVFLALGWMIMLAARFYSFDLEAQSFDPVLNAMEPNRTVLSLPFTAQSAVMPGVPYLHFSVWYQVEKGGVVDVSFASISHHLIRYRSDAMPPARSGFEFEASTFDWKIHDRYDYFLVRAGMDLGPRLFGKATEPVVLRAHNGAWWLYERVRGNSSSNAHP